jgi:hypothetical protein
MLNSNSKQVKERYKNSLKYQKLVVPSVFEHVGYF